jgi:hypothetical protein
VPRYAVRLAIATFLAAAGLGVPAAAQAATCSTSHGVTVVVDFHQLGRGVQATCDAGGAGRTGAQQMADAGHHLTYVQRQPGFVCRVDGTPADDPCVNTPPDNAYWSLWWSDGKSGTWSYAAQGVASLDVPDGGYVALSWQGGDSKAPPRVTPKAHPAPSLSPTPQPSSRPTKPPAAAPASTGPGATPPDAPTSASVSPGGPTATPLHTVPHQPSSSLTATARPSRSPDATQAASAPERAVDDTQDASGSSGLPGWVAPVVVVALLGSAATVAVVRRKRSGGA